MRYFSLFEGPPFNPGAIVSTAFRHTRPCDSTYRYTRIGETSILRESPPTNHDAIVEVGAFISTSESSKKGTARLMSSSRSFDLTLSQLQALAPTSHSTHTLLVDDHERKSPVTKLPRRREGA